VNPAATDELRHYSGSVLIDVGGASWKLNDANSVITTWKGSSEPNGEIVAGLNELTGQRITSAEIDLPGFDLKLRFGPEHVLKVFCDELANTNDNYSIVVDDNEIAAELLNAEVIGKG
jgi:hypothetical protein